MKILNWRSRSVTVVLGVVNIATLVLIFEYGSRIQSSSGLPESARSFTALGSTEHGNVYDNAVMGEALDSANVSSSNLNHGSLAVRNPQRSPSEHSADDFRQVRMKRATTYRRYERLFARLKLDKERQAAFIQILNDRLDIQLNSERGQNWFHYAAKDLLDDEEFTQFRKHVVTEKLRNDTELFNAIAYGDSDLAVSEGQLNAIEEMYYLMMDPIGNPDYEELDRREGRDALYARFIEESSSVLKPEQRLLYTDFMLRTYNERRARVRDRSGISVTSSVLPR